VRASATLSEAQRGAFRASRTRVVAVAQDARSQASRNREIALRRLAERIAQAIVVPKRRRATRPDRRSRESGG